MVWYTSFPWNDDDQNNAYSWVPSPLPWKMLDENGNGSDDDDEDLVEESDEESDDVGFLLW